MSDYTREQLEALTAQANEQYDIVLEEMDGCSASSPAEFTVALFGLDEAAHNLLTEKEAAEAKLEEVKSFCAKYDVFDLGEMEAWLDFTLIPQSTGHPAASEEAAKAALTQERKVSEWLALDTNSHGFEPPLDGSPIDRHEVHRRVGAARMTAAHAAVERRKA